MYERFFGLEDAPFRLTPDPRYLFLSKKHEDALAHLKLGLTESGFVCITGDVGTGKTTLLRYFLANLGPKSRLPTSSIPRSRRSSSSRPSTPSSACRRRARARRRSSIS